MSKTEIVLNSAGVRELLNSSEMEELCGQLGAQICGRCGEGYATDHRKGKTRANSMVWADTYQAKADNMENNTILKALK